MLATRFYKEKKIGVHSYEIELSINFGIEPRW